MKHIAKILALMGTIATLTSATTQNIWETGPVSQVRTQIGTNTIQFTINGQTLDACNSYSWFQFDGSTSQGKNMLTAILSAKASGKKIQVLPAASQGTNCTNTMWGVNQLIINN